MKVTNRVRNEKTEQKFPKSLEAAQKALVG